MRARSKGIPQAAVRAALPSLRFTQWLRVICGGRPQQQASWLCVRVIGRRASAEPCTPWVRAQPSQAKFGDDAAKQLAERRRKEAEIAAAGEDANLIPLGTRVCGPGLLVGRLLPAGPPQDGGRTAGQREVEEAPAGSRAFLHWAAAPAGPAGLPARELVAPAAAAARLPTIPAMATAPQRPPLPQPYRVRAAAVRVLAQAEAAPEAAPEEPIPEVEWWDARILADRGSYGDVIQGQPAQVGPSPGDCAGCLGCQPVKHPADRQHPPQRRKTWRMGRASPPQGS